MLYCRGADCLGRRLRICGGTEASCLAENCILSQDGRWDPRPVSGRRAECSQPRRRTWDPLARRVMTAIEIAEDLFFIERGFLNGNHFVYRGEPPVLIDTGYISHFDETSSRIAALGVDLTEIDLIVNTHTHSDHIGGNRRIQELAGCRIALHEVGKHFIDTRDDWSTWWRYFSQSAEFFDSTLALQDGEILAIGPHRFLVIHTPGHAPDGIALYNPEERVLLSSDALWERDMPVVNLRVNGSASLFETRASLDKLKPLDVGAVYPGHGPPFSDLKAAVARSRSRIERFMKDRWRIGADLLKKIMVYTLLIDVEVEERTFYSRLMGTHWYPDNVDFYFQGAYEAKYSETLEDLVRKDVIRRKDGLLRTTVRP